MSDIFEEGACTEWRISTTVPDGLRMEQVGRGRPLVAESGLSIHPFSRDLNVRFW